MLTADEIRRRLAGTRPPDNLLDVAAGHTAQRLPQTLLSKLTGELTPAGVLIPIIEREDALDVLLTVRSPGLKHHAGQISFPGGRMEPQDAGIVDTALRETEEEVGIPAAKVEIAGFLEPMATVTGYAVTPVIGLVQPAVELTLDPAEVDEVFEVPLAFLLDSANEEQGERDVRGTRVPVVSFTWAQYRIWGATASMLVALRTKLATFQ